MKLLPARTQSIGQEYIDSWRVTVAHYEYAYDTMTYAGILQWELLRTQQGEEYGAFSWGILNPTDRSNT